MSGLEINTSYNVSVRCVVGEDLRGTWSEIINFRTKTPKQFTKESKILSGETDKELFVKKLSEWCGTENFELLYRGSRDGFGASNFHGLCDNKGKTLVLIKNTSGHVFGGFASIPWSCSGGSKQAPGSFLFTLTNMHRIHPTKFSLKNENDGSAVEHITTNGPVFGDSNGLWIYTDCNRNNNSNCGFSSYNNITGKGCSIFSSNSGDNHFQVQEIEVFKVI